MKYNIHFYENQKGELPVWDFLEGLRSKSSKNKDAKIQYKQLSLYIQLLEDNGFHLPSSIIKHLTDDIWELRPGNNRIFFFYHKNDTFVLLHHFRKKTKKTPKREIEKAKFEQADHIKRNGDIHENMG